MAKVEKDPFRCFECGWTSQKWVGRCGECQAWGTVEELAAPKKLSLPLLQNQLASLNSIAFLVVV
jgi:DNA repair protein RadA/Sms